MESPDELPLDTRLNLETARISWAELQRPFARGVVHRVEEHLDLVAVARAFATDDRRAVSRWRAAGSVGPVTDQEAQRWFELRAELWAVVVAPFVLVQARADEEQEPQAT